MDLIPLWNEDVLKYLLHGFNLSLHSPRLGTTTVKPRRVKPTKDGQSLPDPFLLCFCQLLSTLNASLLDDGTIGVGAARSVVIVETFVNIVGDGA